MEIKECTKEFWDAFVDHSPQGTIFNKSIFLTSYGLPVKYLICSKGSETIAGFGFVEDDCDIKTMPYCVFAGIIFKDFSQFNNYRKNETAHEALKLFAEYLFENYREVQFVNHWDIMDMRPFDWINYHERNKGHYQIVPRYTSILDISNPADSSKYAKDRVKDINVNDPSWGLETKESQDIDVLNRLHEMTFLRQDIQRPLHEGEYLMKICRNLMDAQQGKLFVTYMNGSPSSASFFCYDRFRAYYLFGATDPAFRERGAGTKNLFSAFSLLNSQLSIREVDMVGVNSPQRGRYKLSFGGRLVMYFFIKKVIPG